MLRNIAIAALTAATLLTIAGCDRRTKNRPARTVSVSMLNGLSVLPIQRSLENQGLRVVENHGDVYVAIMSGTGPNTYTASFTCGSHSEELTDADSADIAFDIATRCKVRYAVNYDDK
jgi:hypothetical protein